jgi:hypothetical protein
MPKRARTNPYWGPVVGWGSARSVGQYLREGLPLEGPLALLRQSKPSGLDRPCEA